MGVTAAELDPHSSMSWSLFLPHPQRQPHLHITDVLENVRPRLRSAELIELQGVLNGVDDKPEGFDGNIDALLAAKAQAKAQLQASCHLLVRSAKVFLSSSLVILYVGYLEPEIWL